MKPGYKGRAITSQVKDPRGNYVIIAGFNPKQEYADLRESIAVPAEALEELIADLKRAMEELC